jgi:hypothetical protein
MPMLGLVLCCALGVGYLAGAQDKPKDEAAKKPSTLEVGQVLRVGNRIVTAEDLIARIREAEYGVRDDQRLLISSLLYLRDAALFELEAERLGLVLTTEEVESCAQGQITFTKEAVKRRHQGVLVWKDWLAQNYGMTEEQFEAYVRERAPVILRRRALVNYFLQTTEGIEVYHILLAKQGEAEAVHDKLTKEPAATRNKLFEDLAVKDSIDTTSNLNKGRVSSRVYKNAWYLEPPTAEAALWALKDGEVTTPIKSRYGWHVFQRRQTYTPQPRKFADMRDELLKATDPDPNTSNIWVLFVGNTQKYPIEQRVPGLDCKPNQKADK